MLWNGEYYYFLTSRRKDWLEFSEVLLPLPNRATKPIASTQQRYEYDLARFWIKVIDDARKLQIPILDFVRDGSFIASLEMGTKSLLRHPGEILPDHCLQVRL